MKKNGFTLLNLLVLILVLVILYGMSDGIFYLFTEQTISAKVTDIERTSEQGLIIYIKDDPYSWGFIRNVDNPGIMKWNSGRLQGQIERDKVCELTVYGIRWEFFSIAPNLVKVGECK